MFHGYIHVHDYYFSNIFSETAFQIKAKLNVQSSGEEGRQLYKISLDQITKMAGTPMYGKNLSSP